MTTLLERFIPEARDHLESAAAGLLKLERDPSDEGLVNEVFRSVHTLKGASGLFDLPGLTRLLHAGEDLLDAVRSKLLTMNPEIVDALLDGLDRVSAWVDALQQHGRLPDDAESVSVGLSRRLRAFLPIADDYVAADTLAGPASPADWLAELPEADRLVAFAETVAGGPALLAVSYVPDDGCFYRGEDPFNLFPQLPGLRSLQIFYRQPIVSLAEADPFRSALAFRALVAQPRAEVEHLFRYVIEQVVIVSVPPEALILPDGDLADRPVIPKLAEHARRRLAAKDFSGLRTGVAELLGQTDGRLLIASVLRWLDAILAAPLPNSAWASAMITALAEANSTPGGEVRAPNIFEPELAPLAARSTVADTPMAARILAEQLRIVAMPGDPKTLRRRMTAVEATIASLVASQDWSLRGDELTEAAAAAADGMPHRLEKLITGLGRRVEATGKGSAPADASAAQRILAEQLRILTMPGDPEMLRRRMTEVEATIGGLLSSLGWSVRAGELASATVEAAGGMPRRLRDLIIGLETRANAAGKGIAAAPASAAVLLTTGATEVGQTAPGEAIQVAHLLKVDQARIDALMNLITELVVSKNSLPFLAKRAEAVYGSREMAREIKDQYAIIDRLTQEMQRAIMAVRMLPVSEVFERFPRLVRDLSRKLNKHVELKVSGEDTAADKTIIEALGDPLLHLVRNAIDHGIELPEQRAMAGKPGVATIQLKACQEGDRVIIEVSDDGKGINPTAIRLRAFEKGMITEEKADALSDQEAINLIFLPGFSTMDEVSDLSGRGVGTDVVRTAVEQLNGRVTLSSRTGEGTMVRLSLPLSMAVARVMMVEVGEALFGVPMEGIAETVRVPRTRIRRIKRAEAFVLREAIVPLLRLHQLLGLPNGATEVEEEAVLVAQVGDATVGLVVDRLREGIDVVLRPLEGLLSGMRGYSGSALMGDGRVLLVLNLKELL